MSNLSDTETSEAGGQPLTPVKILALVGMAVGMTVFLGSLYKGMSIDPRVDMHGRLVAYTAVLGGFAVGIACRSALHDALRTHLLRRDGPHLRPRRHPLRSRHALTRKGLFSFRRPLAPGGARC